MFETEFDEFYFDFINLKNMTPENKEQYKKNSEQYYRCKAAWDKGCKITELYLRLEKEESEAA